MTWLDAILYSGFVGGWLCAGVYCSLWRRSEADYRDALAARDRACGALGRAARRAIVRQRFGRN